VSEGIELLAALCGPFQSPFQVQNKGMCILPNTNAKQDVNAQIFQGSLLTWLQGVHHKPHQGCH
jgi:hypothetical protein